MEKVNTHVHWLKNIQKNFIGIDIKGARIWSGAKYAVLNSIENACFIRTQIELIEFLFSENEISEIWITFLIHKLKFKDKNIG